MFPRCSTSSTGLTNRGWDLERESESCRQELEIRTCKYCSLYYQTTAAVVLTSPFALFWHTDVMLHTVFAFTIAWFVLFFEKRDILRIAAKWGTLDRWWKTPWLCESCIVNLLYPIESAACPLLRWYLAFINRMEIISWHHKCRQGNRTWIYLCYY